MTNLYRYWRFLRDVRGYPRKLAFQIILVRISKMLNAETD
jgi:hypothetical protein